MPPAITLSDVDDSNSENEIMPGKGAADPDPLAEEDDEDDDDDDVPEDEYVVEAIISHTFDTDGEVKYRVKWQGYEKKSDQTWEPEANLTSAQDVLALYFKKIGGRPDPNAQTKSGRKRSSTAVDSPAAKGRGKKRSKGSESGTPEVSGRKIELPKGQWEAQINSVETIEEAPHPDTGVMRRMAYVIWNDGRRTQHPLNVVNQKCPQKMLTYYEQHLVFKTHEADLKDEDSPNGA